LSVSSPTASDNGSSSDRPLWSPTVILLDEPAAGMTDDETIRTAEIIKDINSTHPLIVVEHDMSFIRRIAQRITVL
jgi:branched-chain amino acid transport system ATP-binding protein/urea transport system ATP-binding protein